MFQLLPSLSKENFPLLSSVPAPVFRRITCSAAFKPISSFKGSFLSCKQRIRSRINLFYIINFRYRCCTYTHTLLLYTGFLRCFLDDPSFFNPSSSDSSSIRYAWNSSSSSSSLSRSLCSDSIAGISNICVSASSQTCLY